MYYPLSQITPNLYTNGEEYVIAATNAPYAGYYWKTSQGKFFTGKNPQDTPTQKLKSVEDLFPAPPTTGPKAAIYTELSLKETENIIYSSIKNPNYKPVQIPTYSPNIPILDNYKLGEYIRYFCKKINETIYLETDKDTYTRLNNKDATIQYQYYLPFNVPWQLTGDKEQVFKVNRNIVELTSKNLRLTKFSDYLQNDFTKYYIETIPYTPSSSTLR